jgi:hypothetical protein
MASMQRHIDCEIVLAKDEALQQNCGFDYAYLLAPEPALSPWLICFTGSATYVNSGS